MGDLPDWTQASSNPGTVLQATTTPAGGNVQSDTSNNNSVVVSISATANGLPVVAEIQWYTDLSMTALVATQYVTAPVVSGQRSKLTVESPVYGAGMVITNLGSNLLSVNVIGASRTVTSFRYLNDERPGQLFEYSGALVSGTAVLLDAHDGLGALFPSNAQIFYSASAPVAGTLLANYVDAAGATNQIGVAQLTGSAGLSGFIALPQAMVSFSFVPTASSASALVFIFAIKATL